MSVYKARYFLALFLSCALLNVAALAQSTTSGDLSGTVTDPTGAVVPNAKVTAKNDNNGATLNATTNGEGFYRFALVQPGAYTVSANATGFQANTRKAQVGVGQAITANIQLAVTGTSTVVEVTTSPIQIESADMTTEFANEQIALVPNPGNDLSAIAQTAPGAVMNTQAGFGNFSTYGLPGTSNLFTLNGQNDNDPFLNLNNSGPTNLLLGANDVQTVTVVNNGYSGQYGQLAGSQINYLSKSGGNQWHGNAIYYWNGRVMNANNYLNNLQIQGSPSTPKPFDNINQWAGSIGGPLQKDKTWFFFNYEGLRVILPTSGQVRIPSPAFQTAALATVDPTAVPFYTNIFKLYNAVGGGAPGVSQPCSSLTVIALTDCARQFQVTSTNFTHEYTVSLRLDHKFSDADSIFGRVQTDRGVQATITDRINPLFNTQSNQPEYQGQLSETHIFNSSTVNELKVSGQWYSAIFDNANRAATLGVFPTSLQFVGGDFSRLGGADFNFPQGRNVTQYQAVDDISMTKGKHTFKFGVNYHRNDVTDFDFGTFTSGLAITSVDTFLGGGVDFFQQSFPTRLSQPIALYGLGVYGQDEWRVNNKLKLTLALRIDHNSNPVCQTNCFARLTSPFTALTHDVTVPYNQIIQTGLHQAYPGTDAIIWEPRFGFTFSPFSNNKTVIRGGIGIFGDSFPAVISDNFASNPPGLNTFVVAGPLSPATPGNIFSLASGANSSFASAFASGGTLGSITATNPFFSPPTVTASDARIRQPRYQEWNLQIEHEIGWNTVISANYVGNHGIFEAVQNNGLNAFADSTNFPTGFAGLPSAAPDPRFSTVNQIQSIAVSNYNGLVGTVRHAFTHGLLFQLNYTWSHALDEVSNGGLLPFNFNTNTSLLNPVNPFNLRANYGNADYDIRHYFSANYVWTDSLRHLFHWGPNAIFGGWNVSGTIFARSGVPFSVVDGGTAAALNGDNFGGTVLGQIVGPTTQGTCGRANATPDPTSGNAPTCLNPAGFASPTGLNFNQGRNQFRGPHYFNTDLAVMKYIKVKERANLGFGVQFFNLLNHPNFDQPVNDISSGIFGQIISTVNTPTSILGSFLGGDASPRLIQLKAEFKF